MIYGDSGGESNILDSGVRPLSFVIFSSLSVPPALIFASRFSRLMRACRCAAVSSPASAILDGCLLIPRAWRNGVVLGLSATVEKPSRSGTQYVEPWYTRRGYGVDELGLAKNQKLLDALQDGTC